MINDLTGNDWKSDLVLLAKNTYVWLNQLSKKYHTSITRLDQIPDAEFAAIADCGFNGLWLVGLWQRSSASLKIKQLYGREDAIASAYSIFEYKPADELGGEKGLADLKEKAAAHDIFLACDMVPNHTSIDSPWIYQHPDRYIAVKKSPLDNFSFNSPNLSSNPSAEIYLEEGYYNQTGAAEVFKLVSEPEGQDLFIYHGNDGTSMPWNDTAQLNYLNLETRQAVLETILDVAKNFRIIRLDAAMTLVREHYKRLWFPSSGNEDSIPTRENYLMTDSEFDQLMPNEFWSEVIQKMSSEAPQTLLIAEAFWLMEKYFINEMGMHRVYNSAFMHQLREEKNKKFRDYLKEILQTSPSMLERFVNFLTTPDERSAVVQFGKSEKYLGACRLLACMPGLPLFGHGQWEGLREQYGMDTSHPTLEEHPDPQLIETHNKLISPLLKNRSWFSSVKNFHLLDFYQSNLKINSNVIAFSNLAQGKRTLVIFNNSPKPVMGSLLGNSKLKSRLILEGLNLDPSSAHNLELIEFPDGIKRVISKEVVAESGIPFNLSPYESHVFLVQPIP